MGLQGFEPWTPGLKVVHIVAEGEVSVNNAKVLDDFILDRIARDLSPNTVRFYTEKLTYLRNLIVNQSLLSLTRVDIQHILMSLPCNPGGKTQIIFYTWVR